MDRRLKARRHEGAVRNIFVDHCHMLKFATAVVGADNLSRDNLSE